MNAAKSQTKKIVFTPKPRPTPALESWIEGEGSKPTPVTAEPVGLSATEQPPSEPMKRFTIDVPESLHSRVKSQCALRKKKMADVIREFLERDFPEA